MPTDPTRAFGRLLLLLGLLLVVLGLLLSFGNKLPFRLGRLPGDIVIKRDGFTFYFPLATSIVLSLVLTLLLTLLRRRP
jgi:formate hydrogenlyase subunit 3/multisubunit Na+/H+ antiporter MnhD subunit